MRGKDEFAIHVPRGVFGVDSSRKFLAKSSPPGFVKRRPLIWKLHATSFQNAFKFDHARFITDSQFLIEIVLSR